MSPPWLTPDGGLVAGVYRGVSDAAYRGIPAVSQSSLKIVGEQGPADYQWSREHPRSTDDLILGSAVDCLLFDASEDHRIFEARFEVADSKAWPNATCAMCGAVPRAPCITKKGEVSKTCHEGRRAAHVTDGREALSWEAAQEAHELARALLGHPTAGRMLATTEHQVPMVWQDPVTGVWMKGRLDCVRPGSHLDDVKTGRPGCAASPRAWAKHAWGFGYHYQAAAYHDGWQQLTGEDLPWSWVVAEKRQPYAAHIAIFHATPAWLELGRKAYRRAAEMFRDCCAVGIWPGYQEEVQEVEPPAWAKVSELESNATGDGSWLEGVDDTTISGSFLEG